MRKQYHQLDPVKMSRAEFLKLPIRQDLHRIPEAGQLYRDRAYPEEVFTWLEYDENVTGEWHTLSSAEAKKLKLDDLPFKDDVSEFKDGMEVRAPDSAGKIRVKRFKKYSRGHQITGEWQMGGVEISE
jgi:hypothetical protein